MTNENTQSQKHSPRPDNQNPIMRALRRSRGRWRAFGFIALALAVLALAARLSTEFTTSDEDYIALVVVEGVITTNAARTAVLEKLADDENVKAIVVRINSPGGTTAGGEELFEILSKLRAEKPVVAVINELGASAAYMTAIATDKIFARRLSIVGSIGVLFNHVDASGLLETIGIDFDKVASGPLKAEPDTDEPMSPEVRTSLQELVDDSFNWFVDIVSERRALTRAQTLALADGQIINGRVAKEVGLIDEFGGQSEAIAWLETKDIKEDLPLLRVYPLPENFEQRLMRVLGEETKNMLGITQSPIRGQTLTGLVSLWRF